MRPERSQSLLLASWFSAASAQYFPPTPEGVTTIQSKFHEGVTISYKQPMICETLKGVKSYSGYVHLPPNSLDEVSESQKYPINTFFWFFESRKDPVNAPLSIWMNGGPGGSSLIGALQENGPCFVGNDSNSTYLNPYSWNNEVNMLYIDEPVQVGYSYDTLSNGTLSTGNLEGVLAEPRVALTNFSAGVPEQNNTFFVGTFPSQNQTLTANSTSHAATALWHFAQTWFEEFPFYKPREEKISIWTESYGGKYGPAFASFFENQNTKISNGTLKGPGVHYLHLDTLGIVNGCIDSLYSSLAYLDQAYNNTYGLELINQTVYKTGKENWRRPGGCKDQILHCRDLAARSDPNDYGEDEKVNKACAEAAESTENATILPYFKFAENGWFDITHPQMDPFPPPFYKGYLNQYWVQSNLGVPVNYTESSMTVASAFEKTGDLVRGGMLEDIAYVLSRGVKVALMYGDRDFACNWIGGERSSLEIPYTDREAFRAAGYAPILVNNTHIGGQVRQYGNLSFSRVYQAGHMVPAYQPETSYQIFMRAMFNRDIATGLLPISHNLSTVGPSNTLHIKNEVLEAPKPVCYILSPGSTCEKETFEMVKNGTAIVKDYIVVGSENLGGMPRKGSGRSRPPVAHLKENQQLLGGALRERKGNRIGNYDVRNVRDQRNVGTRG